MFWILMIAPPTLDESARLANLLEYGILDTGSEPEFDECVRRATELAQVPIGIIVLIDRHRGWYKAQTGTTMTGTNRDISLCSHAILSTEPMLVEDAILDVRFSDHPLVTRGPGIRFYAGFPVVSREGFVLGTLCVLDHLPKKLSDAQVSGLQVIASEVMQFIEKRKDQRKA